MARTLALRLHVANVPPYPDKPKEHAMNNEQTGKQVAQPAEEEIKKHGDQLQRQVDAAAGSEPGEGKEREQGGKPQ